MIVSKRHRFVFFHNPKVAGASVHKALEGFHDLDVGLWGREPDGTVRAHFGIDDFARRYPDTWREIRGFSLFSLHRDPFDRFFSSIGQYSKMYAAIVLRFAPRIRARAFLFDTIAALEALGAAERVVDRSQFTAFRPQWIYFRSDEHDVSALSFPLAEIEGLFRAVEALAGMPVERIRINERERLSLPGPLAWALSSGRVSRGVGGLPVAASMKAWFRRRFGGGEADVFALTDDERASLRGFVERFYARDYRETAALRDAAA